MKDFFDLAKERFSCRSYDSTPLTDDEINKLLSAAKFAPTACNRQPFTLLVVRGESLKKIQNCAWLYGAPLAIVVCTNESEAWQRKYDRQNFAVVDGAIVMTHMLLQAADMGLGSCFIGAIKTDLLTEALEIKEPLRAQFIMVAGHMASDVKPDKLHFERKDLKDQVIYLN